LRKVLAAIGARVVERELPVPAADQVVHDREKLESSGTQSAMGGLVAELIELAASATRSPPEPCCPDLCERFAA
jgi:hypothetical protein